MQAAVSVKALEKQLQQKKDTDPIMAGILEEVRHIFQPTLEHHVPLLIGELVTKSESLVSQTIWGKNYSLHAYVHDHKTQVSLYKVYS